MSEFRTTCAAIVACAVLFGACTQESANNAASPADANVAVSAAQTNVSAPAEVPNAEPPPPIPEVVATFADHTITRDAFLKELQTARRHREAGLGVLQQTQGRPVQGRDFSPDEQQQILRALVDREFVLALAAEENLSIPEDEIDARMKEGKDNLGPGQTYQQYLDWYGITEEQLRDQIRDQIRVDRYFETHLPECNVTADDISEKYEELKAEGQLEVEEEADFTHILTIVAADAPQHVWDKARAELEAIRQRVAAGEDFNALAAELSQDPNAKATDGRYEAASRGVMAPEIDAYLFSAPLNTLSEPIKTSYGLHIVRVDARREAGTRPLETVSERLREFLEQECRVDGAQALLQKLKAERGVEIHYTVPGASSIAPAPEAASPAKPQ